MVENTKEIKENIKTETKDTNETKEQKPTNTRELLNHDEDELPSFDALAFAEQNQREMSQPCKAKLDTFVDMAKINLSLFGTGRNDGMLSFGAHESRSLQLGIFAGTYPVPQPDGTNAYKPSLYLPASFYVGRSDKKKKNGFQLTVRQAVALKDFLTRYLESNRSLVEYCVALEKEVDIRNAQLEDYGF